MNALSRIRQAGFNVSIAESGRILISPVSKLTNEQRVYIKTHRIDILRSLHAANDEKPKRYAYRYEFKNNDGAGVWITDDKPEEAEKALQEQFQNYAIESITLLN